MRRLRWKDRRRRRRCMAGSHRRRNDRRQNLASIALAASGLAGLHHDVGAVCDFATIAGPGGKQCSRHSQIHLPFHARQIHCGRLTALSLDQLVQSVLSWTLVVGLQKHHGVLHRLDLVVGGTGLRHRGAVLAGGRRRSRSPADRSASAPRRCVDRRGSLAPRRNHRTAWPRRRPGRAARYDLRSLPGARRRVVRPSGIRSGSSSQDSRTRHRAAQRGSAPAGTPHRSAFSNYFQCNADDCCSSGTPALIHSWGDVWSAN